MTPDIINGTFEFIGAALIANNSRVLLRDKHVAGFHWTTTGFFTSWGLWNLFYYLNLDQWFSFAGGVAIVAANAVWLALTLYYLRTKRGDLGVWGDMFMELGDRDRAEKAANGCGDK